uniref:ELMO/CED-12 domain containing 1 n=1 Tax=Neogobius melanostomus TaxID=47308 RepID=A0A8C6TCX6_9GOBI
TDLSVFRALSQFLVFVYCSLLWRGLKFILRKVTGRCELQRICYNNKHGARRSLKIGTTPNISDSLLRSALSVDSDRVEKTIDDIMALKKINPDTNPQLGVSLGASLLQIVGYRALLMQVEKLRREAYDCENQEHEEMLLKLWKELRPDTPLSGRISKQWCEIGFQGSDPKTDFRGMGLLGLHNLINLLFFPEKIWSLSCGCRYSFAIVGINMTELTYSLLLSGALKTHLYNVAPELPGLTHFQQTSVSHLMQEFQRFWVEEDPSDIMEFNRVRAKFQRRIVRQLQDPDAALCPHFSASDLRLVNL